MIRRNKEKEKITKPAPFQGKGEITVIFSAEKVNTTTMVQSLPSRQEMWLTVHRGKDMD